MSCSRGFHWECFNQPCCCPDEPVAVSFSVEDSEPVEKRKVTVSAGRKEAARLYPVDGGLPCEWRLKGNCGGGKHPIVGCREGYQKDRHHGPVKDTTRNERNNVHLICKSCHNLWHAKNDPGYTEDEYELLGHEPRELNELEEVMLMKNNPNGKPKFTRLEIMETLYNV